MLKQIAFLSLVCLVNCNAAPCYSDEYEYSYEEEYQVTDYSEDEEIIHCDEALEQVLEGSDIITLPHDNLIDE